MRPKPSTNSIALGYLAACPLEKEKQLDLIRRETQFNLAMVHSSRGRPGPAAEILSALVATHPHEPRYAFNLVTAWLDLARPEPCIEVLQVFLKAVPEQPDALQHLVAAYLMAERRADACSLLATDHSPDWTADHRASRLGELQLLAGDLPAAREMFQLTLSRDATNASAITGLAKVKIAEHRFEEAAGLCLDALELQPHHAEAHHQLGVALAWLGSLDQAALSFQNALALQPGRIESLRFLDRLRSAPTDSAEKLLQQHDFDLAQRSILLRNYPMGAKSWAEKHGKP